MRFSIQNLISDDRNKFWTLIAVSKVIDFASTARMISLKKLYHVFIQSGLKNQNQMVSRLHRFSHTLRQLHVVLSRFDRFNTVCVPWLATVNTLVLDTEVKTALLIAKVNTTQIRCCSSFSLSCGILVFFFFMLQCSLLTLPVVWPINSQNRREREREKKKELNLIPEYRPLVQKHNKYGALSVPFCKSLNAF